MLNHYQNELLYNSRITKLNTVWVPFCVGYNLSAVVFLVNGFAIPSLVFSLLSLATFILGTKGERRIKAIKDKQREDINNE